MKSARVIGPRRFRGELAVPGDKSITHRAVLIGALARGETIVHHPLTGLDCKATAAAVESMGAAVKRVPHKPWRITGRGPGTLLEPEGMLDCGNSGTSIRLLAGVVAGQPITAVLSGDRSICRRPMKRVLEPLAAMGAIVLGSHGDTRAPFAIRGGSLAGRAHRLEVASAQVKSALLLAGLRASGITSVSEPGHSRDHTERMLLHFGAALTSSGATASVQGGAELEAREVFVPGDVSSAAFFLVGAIGAKRSDLRLTGIGLNPTRSGLLEVLGRMGATVRREGEAELSGEPAGNLVVASADSLRGTEVGAGEIPALIDEIPVLAVAAARARGTTRIRGAAELKVKESDRLAGTAALIRAFGGRAESTGDGLEIEGGTEFVPARISSGGDHRIAMSAAIAACFSRGETVIDDVACVETSYPGFFEDLERITEPT